MEVVCWRHCLPKLSNSILLFITAACAHVPRACFCVLCVSMRACACVDIWGCVWLCLFEIRQLRISMPSLMLGLLCEEVSMATARKHGNVSNNHFLNHTLKLQAKAIYGWRRWEGNSRLQWRIGGECSSCLLFFPSLTKTSIVCSWTELESSTNNKMWCSLLELL